jgi:hypothetical protein
MKQANKQTNNAKGQTKEQTNKKQAIQTSRQTKEQTNKHTAVILQSETNVLYAFARKGACPALEVEKYHTYNTLGTIRYDFHLSVGSLSTLITVTSTVTYIRIPTCVQGLFIQPIFVNTTELEVKVEVTLSCIDNILPTCNFRLYSAVLSRFTGIVCVFLGVFNLHAEVKHSFSEKGSNVCQQLLRKWTCPNYVRFRKKHFSKCKEISSLNRYTCLYCYMTHIFTGK